MLKKINYYSFCKFIDINEMLLLYIIVDLINVYIKVGVLGGNLE